MPERKQLKRRIHVIGLGVSARDLTADHRDLIAAAEVLVGGRRQLARFADSPAEKKAIGRDLDEVMAFIGRRLDRRSIVVLASGDPLFFGIGARLVAAFGPQRVAVHPNVSSVAAACARLGVPWGGLPVVSLHGRRGEGELLRTLSEAGRAAVLTDPEHHPAWLAGRIGATLGDGFRMAVAEALGEPGERAVWYTLAEAQAGSFADPNVVILERAARPTPRRRPLRLGTPESWFEHEHGLITKSEVRAVSLARLRLARGHVLWDLGSGSGAVAIEAALLTGGSPAVAVEKDPRRVEQIRANARRFGVRRLTVVQAELPAGIDDLPDPDRIFIGGGGRELPRIIRAAAPRLRPGGVLVVNTVLWQTAAAATAALRRLGFRPQTVQVQINRSRPMPFGERLEALNPVWIVTAASAAAGAEGIDA
jgi:precorrin-6B C5,15-methyltransferase / cobalt-precorrin-6B C5,C15-methyltransferase